MRYNNRNNICGAENDGNEEEDLCFKLYEAIRKIDVESVTLLLKDSKIRLDETNLHHSANPPLLEAAATGNVPLIRALCDTGCDLNVRSMRGETALHVAVSSRKPNPEAISALLSAGCNCNIQENLRGETAVHTFLNKHVIASPPSKKTKSQSRYMDHQEIPELMLTLVKCADINIADHRLRTPLHMVASAKYHPSLLNMLLQCLLNHNPDLNLQNGRGETALHEALENNNTDISITLIKAKTDLHLETNYRETALHIAARKNMYDVVAILLDHHCPVNKEDLNCNTALHLAASRGYKEVVQLLLQNPEIQLNLSNKEGLTPLHLAVESGFIYVVEMLLKAEACDLNARTKRSETALDLAQQEYRRRSQPEMTEVLSRELQRRSSGKSVYSFSENTIVL